MILAGNKGELLFDLDKDPEEKNNLLSENPDIVKNLTQKLKSWTEELAPPGVPNGDLNDQEKGRYKYYFDL